MADAEHVAILRQGVENWNRWRKEHPEKTPDLREANLRKVNLRKVNLHKADLDKVDLNGANLSDAHLAEANLHMADLSGADLRRANLYTARLLSANLSSADLRGANLAKAVIVSAHLREANLCEAKLGGADLAAADLRGANLSGVRLSDARLSSAQLDGADLSGSKLTHADLSSASLKGANLSEADLHEADLRQANLSRADLSRADLLRADLSRALLRETRLSGAQFTVTTVADCDLRGTLGLEEVVHLASSAISTGTLTRSEGKIPEAFLRGCGLSDWEILAAGLYDPDLTPEEINDLQYKIFHLRTSQPIQINHLFISYSNCDTPFVENLESRLQAKGIRYWRDVHDLRAGRLETQIDLAMRLNPIVVLVLSEKSVESDWVEWEAKKARELEKELQQDVLCPVALDEAWKTCRWPGPLRQQIEDYAVLDFAGWAQEEVFDKMFRRLVDGLTLFYKADRK